MLRREPTVYFCPANEALLRGGSGQLCASQPRILPGEKVQGTTAAGPMQQHACRAGRVAQSSARTALGRTAAHTQPRARGVRRGRPGVTFTADPSVAEPQKGSAPLLQACPRARMGRNGDMSRTAGQKGPEIPCAKASLHLRTPSRARSRECIPPWSSEHSAATKSPAASFW